MSDCYALVNPISRIVDKDRTEFTREDLLKVIETQQLERITLRYVSLDGKLKELRVPVTDRYQAERILADGERVDGSSLFKGMVDAALSDLYVVPVYRSAFLNPFDSGSLDVICRYFTKDGELAPFALDTILHEAHQHFRKKTGLTLKVLGELEFFLLSKPDEYVYRAPKQQGYHASAPYIKSGEILNEMVHHVAKITGAVKYAHSEVGNVESIRSDTDEIRGKRAEQMEIEFLPTPVEDAADHLVLSRWLIRNIAQRHGCLATFAPKLEEGIAGNGYHFHMALTRDGKNIMADEEGELSEEARRAIGGLCRHAASLNGFGNTVASAYLRLVPNQEAPTRVCWSKLNRSAMIRVPLGWSKHTNLAKKINPQQESEFVETVGRQTVELRTPDGSAITHLLVAGITMAVEWGLTHDEALALAEKAHVEGNIFQDEEILKTLPRLPRSCVESAQVLLDSRELYERDGIFPPSVIDYVARLLRAEKDEDLNANLIDLPADDRLHETRKLMHRGLHRH